MYRSANIYNSELAPFLLRYDVIIVLLFRWYTVQIVCHWTGSWNKSVSQVTLSLYERAKYDVTVLLLFWEAFSGLVKLDSVWLQEIALPLKN